MYYNGEGVAKDAKKSTHYFELAAKLGHVLARHQLGCFDYVAGNYERAFRHYVIAAKGGNNTSLLATKDGFVRGKVTKDQYAEALRGYQESQAQLSSNSRVAAANLHK